MIIGLDMGGTHIDGVVIKDKKVLKTIKNITDKDNIFNSIWTTLQELLKGLDKAKITRINLSTTVSTNAIVEDKIMPVGMILMPGPGLITDFSSLKGDIETISGYIDHRGKIVESLDVVEVNRAVAKFKEKGIKNCSVVSKFSTRNPNSELEVKDILEDDFDKITLGHRVSGQLNYPRRVFTSYLNSSVYNTFKDFSINIEKSLKREGMNPPVNILKADGGTMDLATARQRPVETILSGPAASLMGINSMLNTKEDAILLDIGGTTTDIFFLADGVSLFEPLGANISDYKSLVRSIFSSSIGLGGDSNIEVVNGKLKIGPERKGTPYAFGGPAATPTDAMIYLELIQEVSDKAKTRASEAMYKIAKELNLSAEETSKLILESMAEIIKNKTNKLLKEINSKPVYTVKELLEGKKLEPKLISIIGGPAKILASFLEKEYDLPIYYPKNYHVANAIGAALAKPTIEITLLADTAQGILSVPEMGIYKKISKRYSLKQAKAEAMELLAEIETPRGSKEGKREAEITEATSFNMVDGFYTKGKNIRIKAQIKPGYVLQLRSEAEDESKK